MRLTIALAPLVLCGAIAAQDVGSPVTGDIELEGESFSLKVKSKAEAKVDNGDVKVEGMNIEFKATSNVKVEGIKTEVKAPSGIKLGSPKVEMGP